jgi:hypothetical protein
VSERTIERQQSVDYDLAMEQQALREIQLIRNEQEMEGLNDRVLQFEESGGIRIVSYNDYEKETLIRDPEGKEQVNVEEITVDEKNEFDSIFEIISEYEEIKNDSICEIDDEKEMNSDFSRDENEHDDMEYDD